MRPYVAVYDTHTSKRGSGIRESRLKEPSYPRRPCLRTDVQPSRRPDSENPGQCDSFTRRLRLPRNARQHKTCSHKDPRYRARYPIAQGRVSDDAVIDGPTARNERSPSTIPAATAEYASSSSSLTSMRSEGVSKRMLATFVR